MRQVPPLDAVWLELESRDTPMHVGGLLEFTLPKDAPADYLKQMFERMRSVRTIPPPWNLRLVEPPLIGPRLPLMHEIHDVDLDYHVRHSALPHPGGQRELGILVSRLHSNQLDLHRPLWEVHLIEGLEGNRFAMYTKTHHSLIDGVSGMRLIMRALSTDPAKRNMVPFWRVGAGARPRSRGRQRRHRGARRPLGALREGAASLGGLTRAAFDLARAAVDNSPLQAPYRAPESALGGPLEGQRRFATQQYEIKRLRAMAAKAECTLNEIVLYLCGSALRSYLAEHARVPHRPLTAGIPVNLREADDQSMGTVVGMIVAELGTNIADPLERLQTIKRSSDRGQASPAHAPVSGPHLLHAAHQRPLHRRPDLRASARPCADPVQPRHLQRARAPPEPRVLQRLPPGGAVPAVAAAAGQRAEHHLRELRRHAELRLHRRPRHAPPSAAPGDLHGRGASRSSTGSCSASAPGGLARRGPAEVVPRERKARAESRRPISRRVAARPPSGSAGGGSRAGACAAQR